MIQKADIIKLIDKDLNSKIINLQTEILLLQKEMGEENKSSAGDKFETSREMMAQSMNRLDENLSQLKQKLAQLKNLPTTKQSETVKLGSLVFTADSIFLFGLALGKLQNIDNKIYALSLNSPLGKAFYGKSEGDEIYMNQTKYTIQLIA